MQMKVGNVQLGAPRVRDANKFAVRFDSNKKKVYDVYREVYSHFHEFSSQQIFL